MISLSTVYLESKQLDSGPWTCHVILSKLHNCSASDSIFMKKSHKKRFCAAWMKLYARMCTLQQIDPWWETWSHSSMTILRLGQVEYVFIRGHNHSWNVNVLCFPFQKVKVKDAHFPDVPEISLNLTLHPRSALARLPESFSLGRTEISTFGVNRFEVWADVTTKICYLGKEINSLNDCQPTFLKSHQSIQKSPKGK